MKNLHVLALLISFVGLPAASGDSDARWVGTWAASVTSAPPGPTVLQNQTVREIVHATVGGSRVRIRLSNRFGTEPLLIGAVHIAIRRTGSNLLAGTDRALTFNGLESASIPPGAPLLSDPVALIVPPFADLAVSIFLPRATPASTVHGQALQTSYVSTGNQVSASGMPRPLTLTSWLFLTGVDVASSADAVVALGDSITDGDKSAVDANSRWPDILARRLAAKDRAHPIAVLNAGIGGNRILHDGAGASGPMFGPGALARFDRDVLAQAGAKYVIVLEGINDLGHPGTAAAPASEEVTVNDITAGLRQLIERAHEKQLRIFGGTILPFEGTTYPGYYKPDREAKRVQVNQWIRSSKAFDAIIDFEKAVADPAHPTRLLPRYDSGDHLHPNDAGYKAMADAVDLLLFVSR